MENKNKEIEEFLMILSMAPDSQLDKSITTKLRNLIDKPISEIKTGVMQAIDDCVYGSLSSEIALKSLHLLHEDLLEGTHEDWVEWRKNKNK